jgi:hypothetical protein
MEMELSIRRIRPDRPPAAEIAGGLQRLRAPRGELLLSGLLACILRTASSEALADLRGYAG